jgi:trimeric autotransporter adhesin
MLFRFVSAALILTCLGVVSKGQTTPDSPAWWLGKAQNDANQLTDPSEKSGVLTTIAFGYLSAANAPAADQAASQASDAAAQIADPQARFDACITLAGYYDQAAESEPARREMGAAEAVVNSMPPGAARQDAEGRLRQFQDIIDGFDQARKSIDVIADAAGRAQALAALADGFARAGSSHHQDFESAIALAESAADDVKDATQSQMLKSLIVQTLARAGDADEAAKLASTITDPGAEGTAYAALADMYAQQGKTSGAQDAVAKMTAAAGGAAEDQSAAIWLNIARAKQALGDKAGALAATDSAAAAAARLESADRADALSAAARLRCRLGDTSAAAVMAGDAATAAKAVTDPDDATEALMSVAAAQARCGLGQAAQQTVAAAQAMAANIPQNKRHPDGDPTPQAMLEVIQGAVEAGDFATAQALAAATSDPHLKHDAALAIAGAEVDLAQYQAAEDTVAKEGSPDAEAAVCGIISASLARNRDPRQAEQWIGRLTDLSDKVAARLAVAQVLEQKK